MKKCTSCEQNKNLSEFYKDKYTPDGFCRKCITCQKLFCFKNKDKINQRQKDNYNPKKKHLYYEKHKKIISEYNRIYHINNKKIIKNQQKIQREKNILENKNKNPYNNEFKLCNGCNKLLPKNETFWSKDGGKWDGLRYQCKHCLILKDQKQKAKKMGYLFVVPSKINGEDLRILLKKQNYFCYVCGKKSNKTLHLDHDHKTGKIRGYACADCNTDILKGIDRLFKIYGHKNLPPVGLGVFFLYYGSLEFPAKYLYGSENQTNEKFFELSK